MCRFPLEPSYSKSLISSILFRCTDEVLTIVSLLSSENLWSKPPRIKEREYSEFEKS
jgi:HrpA-like RNA helicase